MIDTFNAILFSDKKGISHAKTWMNAKCILLSARYQSEKSTNYLIPFI